MTLCDALVCDSIYLGLFFPVVRFIFVFGQTLLSNPAISFGRLVRACSRKCVSYYLRKHFGRNVPSFVPHFHFVLGPHSYCTTALAEKV